MIDCGSLEYAHARLHARHGERIGDAGWRRLALVRDYAPLLDALRATAVRPWLVGLGADSGAHAIEAVLRGHWRALVAEVAGWMPTAWQPALRWCACLPDLPALQHLARGGAAPGWMLADPRWAAWVRGPVAARADTWRADELAPLASVGAEPALVGPAWRAEWHRRLPLHAAPEGGELKALERALESHLALFTDLGAAQAAAARAGLQEQLARLLRRAALDPAAVFVHLALRGLEFERLRGALLRSRLFVERGAA